MRMRNVAQLYMLSIARGGFVAGRHINYQTLIEDFETFVNGVAACARATVRDRDIDREFEIEFAVTCARSIRSYRI